MSGPIFIEGASGEKHWPLLPLAQPPDTGGLIKTTWMKLRSFMSMLRSRKLPTQ